MTRAKSPSKVGAQTANPTDFFFGNRVARINDRMRDVALGQKIGLIDWEKYPLKSNGQPWSAELKDFVHPNGNGAIEYTRTALKYFGAAV